MFCTGISDEAAVDLAGQIDAHRELGWTTLELRAADGLPVHQMDEAHVERIAAALDDAGIAVCGIGSVVANWGRQVTDPFEQTLDELDATLRAARVLRAPRIRVMSYAVLPGRAATDQMAGERFRRLREITARCLGAGVAPVHENCMNFGGMGWRFTLELLEHVPGLELVFDTGNPVFAMDRNEEPSKGRQSAWEFYGHVRHAATHVHIKDARWNEATGKADFCFPGEGEGDVARIVADLAARGYDGALSIEPHMSVVFHDAASGAVDPALQRANYVEYGRRLEAIVTKARGV